MAVPILPGETFAFGEAVALFPLVGFTSNGAHQDHDVASDGRHFIMIGAQGRTTGRELIYVENLFEEVRAALGAGG